MNYLSTFISVAEDCPLDRGTVPQERAGRSTIATVQFSLLDSHPYELTSEDVLFESSSVRRALGRGASASELDARRAAFFARPQACMRTSPLPKKFGWGIHCDDHGRLALYGVETDEYMRLAEDGRLTQLKAMRSKRR